MRRFEIRVSFPIDDPITSENLAAVCRTIQSYGIVAARYVPGDMGTNSEDGAMVEFRWQRFREEGVG